MYVSTILGLHDKFTKSSNHQSTAQNENVLYFHQFGEIEKPFQFILKVYFLLMTAYVKFYK